MKPSKLKRKYARRISVSKIVEQLWCEKKLEIKLMYGIKYRNELMAEGEKRHKEIASRCGMPEPDNFLDWLGFQIYLSNKSLSEFHEKGIAREIFLVADVSPSHEWSWYVTGSVDEIRVFGSKSQIVERKTRKKYSVPKSPHNRIQGMLYHRMIRRLREEDYFNNLRTAYGITKNAEISKNFAKKVGMHNRSIFALSNELSRKIGEIPDVSDEVVIVYEKQHTKELIGEVRYRMDDGWLNRVLSFARAYWIGEREAIMAEEKWRCKYCEVNHLCDLSQK